MISETKMFHIFQPDIKKETKHFPNRNDKDILYKILGGGLARGKKAGIESIATIKSIRKEDVTLYCSVNHVTFVFDYRTLKSEQFCIQIVVGGNKLYYPYDV